MLALAALTVMAAKSRPATPVDPHTDAHIALTIAEVRRLFNALVTIVTGDAEDSASLTLAPQSLSSSPPIPLPTTPRCRMNHEVPLEY